MKNMGLDIKIPTKGGHRNQRRWWQEIKSGGREIHSRKKEECLHKVIYSGKLLE